MLLRLLILFGIAWLIGKGISTLLGDNQRKIVGGGIILAIGGSIFIYGIASMNSVTSRIASTFGYPDEGGIAAILGGVFLSFIGFVVLISRPKKMPAIGIPSASNMKKCEFCAESIQAEAKICRFCGKRIEAPSNTQP